MKSRYLLLSIIMLLFSINISKAQNECNQKVEELIGEIGSTYLIPCDDMVILDIETYSKYRYIEKQYAKMDSLVLGYTQHIDSLDKENQNNKSLLTDKIKHKEKVIRKYKENSLEITQVLEKCKKDSEGFVQAYQEKVNEYNTLNGKMKKVRKQRNTFAGVTIGLAGLLILGALQ